VVFVILLQPQKENPFFFSFGSTGLQGQGLELAARRL
jgi:hypothetical protein